MLWIYLLMAAPDPQAAVIRERIELFCKGKAQCVDAQKEAVRHFLGIMTLYSPTDATAAGCMSKATHSKLTDWVKASDCLRAWSKTQPSPFGRRSRP